MKEQNNKKRQGMGEERLLCKSEQAKMKRIYVTYLCVAIVVAAFQAVVFFVAGFYMIQVLFTVACLAAVIVYAVKASKGARNWLHLYERHFEIKEGSFSYKMIRNTSYDRNLLILDLGGKHQFYVSNGDELCQTIFEQKQKMRAEQGEVRTC